MNNLKITWMFLRVTFPDWAWIPAGVAFGTATYGIVALTGSPMNPLWVHLLCALIGTGGAHRVRRWMRRHADETDAAGKCPHPDHRIRHLHGLEPIERADNALAQCMECGAWFYQWPGGDHAATRCWTPARGHYR